MSCSVARRAALPYSMSIAKAWGAGAPPPLCGTQVGASVSAGERVTTAHQAACH